jgi:predicted membrane protein
MEVFIHKSVLIFFSAMGIILGASFLGSFAAVLVKEPPIGTMLKLAQEMKIWAIVAAIGGTFSTFEIFQSGLFQGEFRPVIKQILYIFCALAGTQVGYHLLLILSGEVK